jgi:hypothetical protein
LLNGLKHLRIVANPDGAAILDTERGAIVTLNPTGADIWQALQRGASVDAVIRSLVRDTDEPIEMIERDVHEFLEVLREKHLLSGQ